MPVDITYRSGSGAELTPAQIDANFKALQVAVESLQGSGSGTVTSVGLSMPSGFSVGGSPVTTSGTLAVTTSLNGFLKGNGSGFTAQAAIVLSGADVSGTLPYGNGGTGATSFTNGRVVVSGASALSVSSVTTTELGYVSGVTSAIQTQLNAKEGTITVLSVAKGGTGTASIPTNGQLLIGNGTGYTLASLTTGPSSKLSITPGAGSIQLDVFTASETQNLVWASPNGSSGAPTFRALVADDIPNLDAAKITTGTLGVARGGTGTGTAFTAGSVVFAGASGVYSEENATFFWNNTDKRLGLGTTTPLARLHSKGTTANDTAIALLVEDSAAVDLFTVRNDGAFAFKGGTVGLADSGWLDSATNYIATRTLGFDFATVVANDANFRTMALMLETLMRADKARGVILA